MKKTSLKVKDLIKTKFSMQGPSDIHDKILSNRVDMLKQIEEVLNSNCFTNEKQILDRLKEIITTDISYSDNDITIFKDLNNTDFIDIELNDKEIINSIEKIYVNYLNKVLEWPEEEDNNIHCFSMISMISMNPEEEMIKLAVDKYEKSINSTIEIDLKTIILSFLFKNPLNYKFKNEFYGSKNEYIKNPNSFYDNSELKYTIMTIDDDCFYNRNGCCRPFVNTEVRYSISVRDYIMTQINMYSNILSIKNDKVVSIGYALDQFVKNIIDKSIEEYFHQIIREAYKISDKQVTTYSNIKLILNVKIFNYFYENLDLISKYSDQIKDIINQAHRAIRVSLSDDEINIKLLKTSNKSYKEGLWYIFKYLCKLYSDDLNSNVIMANSLIKLPASKISLIIERKITDYEKTISRSIVEEFKDITLSALDAVLATTKMQKR